MEQAGEKEGPEYETEQEVQAAVIDGLHIGYFCANGKYMRLHTTRGRLRANRKWKPGAPSPGMALCPAPFLQTFDTQMHSPGQGLRKCGSTQEN